MNLTRVQRDLYKAQRGIGDYRALQRGPDVLARRLIRRKATRSIFAALRKAGIR